MPVRRDWYQLEIARLRKLREELDAHDGSLSALEKLNNMVRHGEAAYQFIREQIQRTRTRAGKDRLEKIALRMEIDALIDHWKKERQRKINRFIHRLALDAKTKARLKRWKKFQRKRKQ